MALLRAGIRRDPYYSEELVNNLLGQALTFNREHEEAIRTFLSIRSKPYWVYRHLAVNYFCLGRLEEARAAAAECLANAPNPDAASLSMQSTKRWIKKAEDREFYLQACREVGLLE